MTAIILKAIFSSGLFLVAYKLLLEKEKMHQFNRFYLLFSLLLAFVIPFLTIRISVPVYIPIENALINTEILDTSQDSFQRGSVTETNNLPLILWTIYTMITGLLLVRFVIMLKGIFDKISNATIVPRADSKFVLMNEKSVSYSFLSYIFVNKEEYEKGEIEQEILLHELTHARQKHTADVLFIEMVFVIFWFNPFIILYRRAIQLNHEFLADEKVIRSNHNRETYLQLLVTKAGGQTRSVFMSSFNYLITKKRLIMMTKTTSNCIAIAKQGTSLLLFVCTVFFLSTKTYAQSKGDQGVTQFPERIQQGSSVGQNSPQKKKYEGIGEDDKYYYLVNSQKYYKLAKSQPDKPFAKRVPTDIHLQKWADSKIYGVWIDEKRIVNEELSKYIPSDFAWFGESKLSENAKDFRRYVYQINLKTNENYEQYLKNWEPNKSVRGGSWEDVKDILEAGVSREK